MRNRRTFLLLLAVILAIAVVLVNRRPRPKETINLVPVVIARQDIEPYSIISSDQVTLGSIKIPVTLAKDYYEQPQELAGLMTTHFIKAGQQIGREDAKPIEKVRYVEDMHLEIVSFPAVFSEMVAGQVQPGHKVNIYGYRTESGLGNPGELILIASNVWVVDVRTASGEMVKPEATEEAKQEGGGLFGVPGVGTVAQPASVVTVAARPDVVQDIIHAFGAKGYSAWVTLAPSPENITPVAIMPTAMPAVQETPTTTVSIPTVVQTPTSLVGAIYMSNRDGGPKVDTFPNNTSVVWAIVNLQYSPSGPMPIRIDVHGPNETLVFEGDFTHPKSGQESYLIVPTSVFAPDTMYTTTLYAGGKTFSVKWELRGDARLPGTGEDSASGGE